MTQPTSTSTDPNRDTSGGIAITRGSLSRAMLFAGLLLLTLTTILLFWGGTDSTVLLVMGIAGVASLAGSFIALPPRYDAASRFNIQRLLKVVITLLLLLGIITMLYTLAQQNNLIADVTIDNQFTLDDKTVGVIRNIERSNQFIRIIAFYDSTQVVQREVDGPYLALYEEASNGHIRVTRHDPIEEPGFATVFATYLAQGFNIFVAFEDEMGNPVIESALAVNRGGSQEREITTALSQILVLGEYTVYFVDDIGSYRISDTTPQGLSTLAALLEQNGFGFDTIDLADPNSIIPDDASVVVLAGLREPLDQAQTDRLDAYLQRGGDLLVAADFFYEQPRFLQRDNTFESYLWQNYGIGSLDAIIVDSNPATYSINPLNSLSAAVFENNSLTDGINIEGNPGSRVLMQLAQALRIDDDPPVSNGQSILSSEQSWGETDIDGIQQRDSYSYDADSDIAGPLPSALWADNRDNGSRVVLIGDAGFMTNSQISSLAGNYTFALNAISWLTGYYEETSFGIQAYSTTPVLFVDTRTLDRIAFATTLLLPGLFFVAATLIAYRRRAR